MLYVHRETEPGRHEGKKDKNLFVGQFGSMKSELHVEVARLKIGVNDGV